MSRSWDGHPAELGISATARATSPRWSCGGLSHYAVRRKPRQRRALVLFDEFSSLEGPQACVSLIDRARGPHVGVVLCAQSAVLLGDEDEHQRLLASAAAILTIRTPTPAPDRPGRQRQGAEAASWSRTAR